jgi:outer membrane protein assembly factor BamB
MVATRRHTDVDDWDGIFQRNQGMGQAADRLNKGLLEKTLVDWELRIKAGEVPASPPRPTGIERNFVVSQWDWGTRESFFHDVTSTDKRNPTLYSNGKVYGADRTGGGVLWVLDPLKNTVEGLPVVPRNPKGYSTKVDYYHDRESEDAWMASPHNPMLDEHGRVWMTQPTRPPGAENNPKWSASTIATDNPDPAALAIESKALLSRSHGMQLGFYDTKTNKFVGVDTSYNTHHLQFDWQGRIWTDGDVLGELDTTKIDPANPEGTEAAAEHAWMRADMDTKKVIPTNGYATAVSPIDGTVWLSVPVIDGPQNKLYMLDPKTSKFKDYPLPLPGRLSHGIDFSTDGTVWFSAGSGHLGRLDPKTGKFKYWDLPGPKFTGTGMETGSTEYPYFLWVDQFDTLGLGKDTVIVTGTTSDSMLIFDPRKEMFSVFRMAYPMPFYTRGLDGRIDDAKAGWKGRGIWATYSSYMPKFTETRLGSVNHIQVRPSPLAN